MTTDTTESVEAFEARAEAWIVDNLPSEDAAPADGRELQRLLFDNGFAGIAFPKEYGGAGLSLLHQKAFFDAASRVGRQVPTTFMVSIGMLGPTLLDHASHENKLRFLPALLRGDEEWIQLLSEPQGGSDMAGSITRLTPDGDSYILNGAKMWSSGAHHADYGLCLCRSDWDAPKHRGLSMIAVPLKGTKGISIEQIRAANGLAGEFCQEFFDDVVLPGENIIGELNKGWSVAQSLLFHERNAVGSIGFGYLGSNRRVRGGAGGGPGRPLSPSDLTAIAAQRGILGAVGPLIAEAYLESVVGPLTAARVMTGMRVGTHQGQWGSLLKLQGSEVSLDAMRAALAVVGSDAVIWDGEEVRRDNPGTAWLGARGGTIAGGTSEMQRNIISERLLGLPREPSDDREMPFNQSQRKQNHTR